MVLSWLLEVVLRVVICLLGLELFQGLFLSLCLKNKVMLLDEIQIILGNQNVWVCQYWVSDYNVKYILFGFVFFIKEINFEVFIFKDFFILYRIKDV